MNKAREIASINRLLKAARTMQDVAMQNFSLAAQIESEQLAALEELGVQPGRARKGKNEIPSELKLKLQSGMTKKRA